MSLTKPNDQMPEEMIKDKDYYLDQFVFLVEGTLFKLPAYRLENQSCVFNAMFTLPPSNGEVEGQTDDRPIRLDGIKAVDFRSFLKVLYPKQYMVALQLSEEEWLSALKLSTQWAMDTVRAVAIGNLLTMIQNSPHKLIVFGKQHDVQDWIFFGVEKLVLREEPLDEKDVTALGIAEVLKLASIRECLTERSFEASLRHGRGRIARDKRIDAEIRASFSLERIPAAKDRPPLA